MSNNATRLTTDGAPPRHRAGTPAAGAARLELIAPSASAEEAAAIVAALERFMRATAPPLPPREPAPDAWRRAAILEAVTREEQWDGPHPWINT